MYIHVYAYCEPMCSRLSVSLPTPRLTCRVRVTKCMYACMHVSVYVQCMSKGNSILASEYMQGMQQTHSRFECGSDLVSLY